MTPGHHCWAHTLRGPCLLGIVNIVDLCTRHACVPLGVSHPVFHSCSMWSQYNTSRGLRSVSAS